MNKKFQLYITIVYLVGAILLIISRIFRHSITDFTRGFCEGFFIVSMILWLIFVFYCLLKKKNPYKIN